MHASVLGSTGGRHIDLSKSGEESGWASYPADLWNESKPTLRPEEIRFWRYCAEKYGGPILDLCCGNGRYAIPLAKLGYEVVGVDVNQGMIAAAQRWTRQMTDEAEASRLTFHVADIVTMKLRRRFRLAIMPGWSFQVLLTQEDQLSFLRRLRAHLMPRGAYAFNLFMPFHRQHGLIEKDGVYEWPRDPSYHSGAPRTYDPVSQTESLVESNVHPIRLRHTTLSEFKLLFQLTGFEIAEIYGDDEDMRPFTGKEGDDYTIIARRT